MIAALRARFAPAAAPPRRRGGFAALILAFFAFATVAAAATPKFPALTGRVVDDAHILSAATTEKLDGELAGLEQRTGHQLVVVTVPDLQGFEIEDYGYQLGRTWQLGRKGVNDGVILLVAPKEHKVRVEVGYGLEPVLTDALSNVILQRQVLPQFKQGHMEAGVVAGVDALLTQLSLPDDQAKANVAQAAQHPAAAASERDSVGPRIPIFLILFILFWVISGILRAGGRGFGGAWWLLPFFLGGGGRRDDWGGGGGGGGFSGGGGSFGGGGSSGSW